MWTILASWEEYWIIEFYNVKLVLQLCITTYMQEHNLLSKFTYFKILFSTGKPFTAKQLHSVKTHALRPKKSYKKFFEQSK